jgi:photosystem II stability/assembly factor-like uncharacterized protein
VINKFTVSVLTIAFSLSVHAQSAYVAPLVKESILLDVVTFNSANTNKSIVVGERGHVLIGDNNQLDQVSVPSTVTLTAVDAQGDTYLAVGHDASILRSQDAGASWEVVFNNVELDRPFLDVMFLNANEAIAIGGYGLFYRTQDAGSSWSPEQQVSLLSDDDNEYLESIADDPEFYQEELNYIFPHFNRLSKRGDDIYLVGEAGLIAKSTDGGQNWKRFDVNYDGSFFDVQQLSNGSELAVGLRGNMFVKGTEQDWSRISTCVTSSLNSIADTEQGLFVVGNNGVVLSVDANLLNSNELQEADTEGCRLHVALSKINSDISSSISNAFIHGGVLTAVSANGLQPVE